MNPFVHRVYILILVALGIAIVLCVAVRGWHMYATSATERGNIVADYDARISAIDVEIELRKQGLGGSTVPETALRLEQRRLRDALAYWSSWGAAGPVGHGLGVVGALMMMLGVTVYSTRKRVRRFRMTGRIKHFLELHIFLCLVGPALVVFHSTFKFGGIVSVSLWSMVFVALSGIAGRYIYGKIPRGEDGHEVTAGELHREGAVLRMKLKTQFHLSEDILDRLEAPGRAPSQALSVPRAFLALLRDDLTRRARMRESLHALDGAGVPAASAAHVLDLARRRATAARKAAMLDVARGLFQYWHVIHLPFSVIMFLILIVHVVLSVSLGYTWIF
jgi:hypothetical protein